MAEKTETIINGKALVLNKEALFGILTTAHILGGDSMDNDSDSGVIDRDNRVINYQNKYVCERSMISANPGVNPSLSITAIPESGMLQIPDNNK